MFEPNECEFISTAQAMQQEQAKPIHEVIRLTSRALAANDNIKNEEIADFAMSYNTWTVGETYQKGEIVTDPYNGRPYIIVQTTTASDAYPPHAEGVLSNYRPVPVRNPDGTFVFIYGQNVFAGDRCYDSNGVLWKARKDMLPCTWTPSEGNEWSRE